MLDEWTTEIVALRAVAASTRPLSVNAVVEGRLFTLEMIARTLPRVGSVSEPYNLMPLSSILIVSSLYFSIME